ncbi:Potato type II proteinase inhibitor family [Musa troglodytarum]|uniref:Potato type II proteinase inhibitor family n=1 Tax=Musa troglodytarum TaxID=320322 RepID=A0A9E7FRK7_9LILI|nr:Potato type II proteinase inhibitor family [Musa troglodytarum]
MLSRHLHTHTHPSSKRPSSRMSSTKLPLAILLLLSGTVMFGWIQYCAEAKVCPLFCVQAEYMTCNSTAGERLNPVCNCCFAPGGDCTIYLSNGGKLQCA